MESTELDSRQFALARWIIGRSDSRRAEYSSRAATIISADAIALAVVVLVADGLLARTAPSLRGMVAAAIAAVLACLALSVVFAMAASAALRKSSDMARYSGPPRVFFNPRDTFETYPEFHGFSEAYRSLTRDAIAQAAAAELWVGLRLQRARYGHLRRSIWMLIAGLLLVTLLLIGLLLWPGALRFG